MLRSLTNAVRDCYFTTMFTSLPRPKPRRFLQRFAPLHLGVPHWRGSGYILWVARFTPFPSNLIKPSPWSRPQGVTIPNAKALLFAENSFNNQFLTFCVNQMGHSIIPPYRQPLNFGITTFYSLLQRFFVLYRKMYSWYNATKRV